MHAPAKSRWADYLKREVYVGRVDELRVLDWGILEPCPNWSREKLTGLIRACGKVHAHHDKQLFSHISPSLDP